MFRGDEEKTAFVTLFGVFCYVKMHFGLKSTSATYQHCIQLIIRPQLSRNVKVYVDDVIVRSRIRDNLVTDLQKTFDNLQKYRMKLDPEKCMFGVPSRKLLGLLIFIRGIEANPDKIRAINWMKSLTRLKEVHKLIGCVAALSRFI